jgi:type I restriction enzyme S subunit
MKFDYLRDTQEHVTNEAVANSATRIVPPGSVLVVVKSKILARTLPVAIAEVHVCFGQDLKAIICGERLASEYLASLLRGSAKMIIAQARGLNTEGLTLEILGRVSAPVPPLALQREFARRVKQLRAIAARQAESGERLEALSRSLTERAFNGEI